MKLDWATKDWAKKEFVLETLSNTFSQAVFTCNLHSYNSVTVFEQKKKKKKKKEIAAFSDNFSFPWQEHFQLQHIFNLVKSNGNLIVRKVI